MILGGKSLGKIGEDVAVEYLRREGYQILDRNYQRRWGEIDIVAKKGKDIIFCEVKTLKKPREDSFLPEESVRNSKKKSLIKTAKTYLSENKYPENQNWQIDVIGIEFFEEKKCRLRHTKNALTE